MATKELFDPQPAATDGRSIDRALGVLAGEGAQIRVHRPGDAFPIEPGTTTLVPTQAGGVDPEGPTYYGLPMLKSPVWKWVVPAYYWVGGAAGAASTLSMAAGLFGGRPLARLARRARWLAAIGDSVGAVLLIYDLGRPLRFLNMLRTWRPSSPMSVGSWVLSTSGATNVAALLLGDRRGLLGGLAQVAGIVGGLLGMPLAGYTAVLLGNTAVPVWLGGRRSLPLVFMCSGVAAAGSLMALDAATPAEERAASRYAVAGQLGELAATVAYEREVSRVPRAARPLHQGAGGALMLAATVLTGASLAAALWPGGGKRRRRTAALLGALGSLALRFGVHEAGKASAADPRASFAQQRAGAR